MNIDDGKLEVSDFKRFLHTAGGTLKKFTLQPDIQPKGCAYSIDGQIEKIELEVVQCP
jgi:hypothetical protein